MSGADEKKMMEHEFEELIIKWVEDNDFATPMIEIADLLRRLRDKVIKGDYDEYEKL